MQELDNSQFSTKGLNLLIPNKKDAEREAVAIAFAKFGGTVHRLDRFWDPPSFDPPTVRVYGPDSFCLVLQQKIRFPLHSPPTASMFGIPPEFLKREINSIHLKDATNLTYPAFIKSMQPKQFRAAIYNSAAELLKECEGLSSETGLYAFEPVNFVSEMRCFIWKQEILDCALYEGSQNIAEGKEFIKSLTEVMTLPRTIVVDVGFIPDRGWAVIELNASWGSGLNGCDAEEVLPGIIAASGH